MKKVLLGLFCFGMIISLTACNSEDKTKPSDKDSENNQATIIEDQKIGNISFESFNVVLDEYNVSHIYFEVINDSEEVSNISNVTFTLYESNLEIFHLTKPLNGPLEPGDMRVIEVALDIDLSKIDKVVYSVE